MKRDDVFPSNWLKAEHLVDKAGSPRAITLTIAGVETVSYRDGSTARALSFEETDKKLGLNKTNWEACEKITGEPDDERWAGHKVECFRTMVEFAGKMVPGIRVRPKGGWDSWAGPGKETKDEDLPF